MYDITWILVASIPSMKNVTTLDDTILSDKVYLTVGGWEGFDHLPPYTPFRPLITYYHIKE